MSGAHPRRPRLGQLADLPITLKVFLAPCVILAALLGLALAALGMLAADETRLHDISAGALPAYQRAAEAKDAVNATQTALQHMLSVAANESDPARIGQAAVPVRQSSAGTTETFARLPSTGAGSESIASLRQGLGAYQAALDDVVKAAASDPASATMLMSDVEDRFNALSTALDRYRDQVEAAGQRLAQDASDAADRARLILVGGCAGALAVCVLLTVLAARAIARPVVQLTATMGALADGQLDLTVPAMQRRDEIGAMARAVDVFRANEQRARALSADRDAEHAGRARRQAAMDQQLQDFGGSVSGVLANLGAAAEGMRSASSDMMGAAHRTRDHATRTAAGANASSENLAAVAAGVEQMSASVDEISRQVAHASAAARIAVDRSSATDSKVATLAVAVDRIGTVVQLIATIAGRTNLLALNATIESARAGAAGKGFAVVATEVKALAAQTAKATEEIATQIVAIRSATGEAVDAVHQVGAAIGDVDAVATAIAAAVEQQAAATREIVARVNTVAEANGEVTKAMADVSEVAETADEAAGKVLEAAHQIGGTSDALRQEVDEFLVVMARHDEAERRRYERIPGRGQRAVLEAPGQARTAAVIQDISRGGIALMVSWAGASGSEVMVLLPGTTEPVPARVVRSGDGRAALAFRQEPTALAKVDTALATIGGDPVSRAA
ncbi:MAG: methyl-accepting chemotaxis protein [Acetobacteraceae bacterium]|jgi:methyl-accepting chemotaxis protein